MLKPREFKQFGLNEKEARVYLAALELGASSVQDIAAKAEIHRVSTYDLLESLMEKGFIRQEPVNGKRLLRAAEPDEVIEIIRAKEKRFAELAPELNALRGRAGGSPRAACFEGEDKLWQARLACLRAPDIKELLIIGADIPASLFPAEARREAEERQKTGIAIKRIVSKGAARQAGQRETIKQAESIGSLNKETIICGNQVLIITWNKKIALLIDDPEYADDQRLFFNLLWNALPTA